MNKEIIKAMQGKNEHKAHRWWNKNNYKVFRIIFFPIWVIMVLKDKIVTYLDSKEKWDEKRADKIFNYFIPRRAEWDNEEKCFYYFNNGLGWSLTYAKKFLKRKDRRFWKVNCGWYGGKMRKYLIEQFQLEGFTKEVRDTWDDWTDISFKLIENKQ